MLYWSEMIGEPAIFDEFRWVFEKLQTGDYTSADLDLKRRVGDGIPIWSIRVNDTIRILMTEDRHQRLVVLTVLRDHNYKQCHFFKNKKAVPDLLRALERVAWEPCEPPALRIESLETNDVVYYHNDDFIQLSLDQQAGFQSCLGPASTLPIFISGSPGTGKTVLGSLLMRELVKLGVAAHMLTIEPDGDSMPCIIYVSDQFELVNRMKKAWETYPFSYEPKCDILFLTYQQLIHRLAPETLAYELVEYNHADPRFDFKTWFKDYQRRCFIRDKQRYADIPSVIEEFRIISGYDELAYMECGRKESLFQAPDDRVFLRKAYEEYQSHLEALGAINIDLWRLKAASPICDVLFVDEVQTFGFGQLKNIVRAVEHERVIFMGDVCQDAHDRIPNDEYLYKLFYKTKRLTTIRLGQSFRCGRLIQASASYLLDLMQMATGGVIRHIEAQQALPSLNLHEGSVLFLDNDRDGIQDRVRRESIDDLLVFTRKEHWVDAKERFPDAIIIPVEHAGGIECDTAILYRVFETNALRKANACLKENLGNPLTGHRYKKSDHAHAELEPFFRELFMLMTRAINRLWIVTDTTHLSTIEVQLRRFIETQCIGTMPLKVLRRTDGFNAVHRIDLLADRLQFEAVFDLLSQNGYTEEGIRAYWLRKAREFEQGAQKKETAAIHAYLKTSAVFVKGAACVPVMSPAGSVISWRDILKHPTRLLESARIEQLMSSTENRVLFLEALRELSLKKQEKVVKLFFSSSYSSKLTVFERACFQKAGIEFIIGLYPFCSTFITAEYLSTEGMTSLGKKTVLASLVSYEAYSGILKKLLHDRSELLAAAPWFVEDENGNIPFFECFDTPDGVLFLADLIALYPHLLDNVTSAMWNKPRRPHCLPALFCAVSVWPKQTDLFWSIVLNQYKDSKGAKAVLSSDWFQCIEHNHSLKNFSCFYALTTSDANLLHELVKIKPDLLDQITVDVLTREIQVQREDRGRVQSPLDTLLCSTNGRLIVTALLNRNPLLLGQISRTAWLRSYTVRVNEKPMKTSALKEFILNVLPNCNFQALLRLNPTFFEQIKPEEWSEPFERRNQVGELIHVSFLEALSRVNKGFALIDSVCNADKRLIPIAFEAIGFVFHPIVFPSNAEDGALFFKKPSDVIPSQFELLFLKSHDASHFFSLAKCKPLLLRQLTKEHLYAEITLLNKQKKSLIDFILSVTDYLSILETLYHANHALIVDVLCDKKHKGRRYIFLLLTLSSEFFNTLHQDNPEWPDKIPVEEWTEKWGGHQKTVINQLCKLILSTKPNTSSVLERILMPSAVSPLKTHLRNYNWVTSNGMLPASDRSAPFFELICSEKGLQLLCHLAEDNPAFKATMTVDLLMSKSPTPIGNVSLLHQLLASKGGRAFFLAIVRDNTALLARIPATTWIPPTNPDDLAHALPLLCLCQPENQDCFLALLGIYNQFPRLFSPHEWFKSRPMWLNGHPQVLSLRQVILLNKVKGHELFNALCRYDERIIEMAITRNRLRAHALVEQRSFYQDVSSRATDEVRESHALGKK